MTLNSILKFLQLGRPRRAGGGDAGCIRCPQLLEHWARLTACYTWVQDHVEEALMLCRWWP